MALEKLLDIQNGDIYDYISKEDYDAILGKQPSDLQRQMEQEQMRRDAQNTAMQEMAGGGQGGGSLPMGQQMAGDGMSPTQPQNANEVARPQSNMMSLIDASVGRAGSGGFFPG